MAETLGSQSGYEAVEQTNSGPANRLHGFSGGHIWPKVYYGNGPFEASSSDSGDDLEVYGEKDIRQAPIANGGEHESFLPRHNLDLIPKQQKSRALRFLLICLGSLAFLAASLAFFSGQSRLKSQYGYYNTVGTKRITMDHVFNGTFSVEYRSLRWIPEAGDGVFSIEENGHIKLVDLRTNTTKDLVRIADVRMDTQMYINWDEWSVSSDLDYILIKSDSKKQWRYSSHASYFIHRISTKSTRSLTPLQDPPTISIAMFSPSSPPTVLFVENNDLYMLKLPADQDPPVRITMDGSATVFNGVPDWVYEEEVFAGDKASWWSPDGRRIAFLRLDETKVKEFKFPIYNKGYLASTFETYTPFTAIKYPKAGTPNPLVTLHVFDTQQQYTAPVELTWDGRLPINDSIIFEVVWISNTELMIKEADRGATKGQVLLFDIPAIKSNELNGGPSAKGKIVRQLGKNGEQGDDGWIDENQYIWPLKAGGYLDIIPTPEGYDHIAFFPKADTTSPFWITRGEWEVDGPIEGVDEERGIVYFKAANPSSIERHIFSAPLPDRSSTGGGGYGFNFTALTNTSRLGWHTASFSPECGFYVLRYDGPDIPHQRVLSVRDDSFGYVLAENEPLRKTVSEYMRPSAVFSTVMSDGFEINAVELRPPNFDSSGRTKYPVLFRVYGGPHSQLVDTKFNIGWHDYLASTLGYIIVKVDGRGTFGPHGRKLRNPIKNQLGKYETIDQINAAKEWAKRPYVDKDRIGVWGWSYGGFMASKIAEANEGVHKLAISVAPVTDWRMYDTIYTERYMSTPARNPDGYNTSAVHDVTGFNAIDFALAHGSGDDNVHFANSAHLLDLFTVHQIRNFRFRMFTDSDHSISMRGAYRELHEWLTSFLLEKWGPGVPT